MSFRDEEVDPSSSSLLFDTYMPCRLFIMPLLLVLLVCRPAGAQSLNFQDGFEDGNFSENPSWSGTDSLFSVVKGTPNYLLQLNGDSDNGGTAYLSAASSGVVGEWDLYMKLDGFSPSNSNRADIFLMSDRADLTGAVNGYALRAGENGSDDVFKIVRYDQGMEAALVLAGTTNISAGGAYRVRIIRDSSGSWSMEVAVGYDEIPAGEGGSATDNTYTFTSHFGVRVTYTSTRHDKFYFDFKIDLPPFAIVDAVPAGTNVDVFFNRPYDPTTVQTGDFILEPDLGNPVDISFPTEETVRLHFADNLPSNEYILSAGGISDLYGEPLDVHNTTTFTVFDVYRHGDVVINEFMYDQPPDQSEYLELYNRTAKYLNLQGWQLTDGSGTYTITLDTLTLPAHGYLVVSADTTTLYHAYGHRSYVLMPSFPSLNNTGDLIRVNTPGMLTADSLVYSPSWGGTDVSLERRSDSVSATYRENWGDSPHLQGGTPGKANLVPPDTISPALTHLNAQSTHLMLAFSERVDQKIAETPTQYILKDEDQFVKDILAATLIASDSIRLDLMEPLANNVRYTLGAQGITDLFGNVMEPADTAFTYYEVSPVDSGDIFITEFMYDPPSGSAEYIELHNASDKSLDLNQWSLVDNTGIRRTISSVEYILPPKSYVVLTTDETIRMGYPDISVIEMGGRFPSLNNGGDIIMVNGSAGEILDSLKYDTGWGGHEVSLERRSITVPGYHAENFGDSPTGYGTPGSVNKVAGDLLPPELIEAAIIDERTIRLDFSEFVDPESALRTGHYTLNPHLAIQHISADDNQVRLSFTEKFNSGFQYELNVMNITDLFGNVSEPKTTTLHYLRYSAYLPGDIVINEFLPADSDQPASFVELWNRSDKNFDLSGWIIGDSGSRTVFPPGSYIKEGEHLVITEDDNFSAGIVRSYRLQSFPYLHSQKDAIHLRDRDGVLVDSLYYDITNGWLDLERGRSMERKDPEAASNDPANWGLSLAATGHTAGEGNSIFRIDDTPPDLIFATLMKNGTILARFSEFLHLHDELKFNVNGTPLRIERHNETRGDEIILSAINEWKADRSGEMLLEVFNLQDIKSNIRATSTIPIAFSPEQGDLVINEIMYQPIADPNDQQPDQGEYIELRNIRDAAISLEGVSLRGRPDETGKTRALHPAGSRSAWIPAGGFALLYSDKQRGFNQSRLARFFGMKEVNISAVLRFDQNSLGLRASGDAIYLADSTGLVIDSVAYSEEWHNPNIIDRRGISLEKINPFDNGNNEANWSSNTLVTGGSPLAENSIFQSINLSLPQEGISFSPNPFSPDDDGYEDYLLIQYRLDGPDYLASVYIYDRFGRLVRRLANGRPVSSSGSLIWDGRKDDGAHNRIGIYIVVFEGIDNATGRRRVFKDTVVLARRLH